MIYKKYVIELTISNRFIQDVDLNNQTTYQGISFNLNSVPGYKNTIAYLDTYSVICDHPAYFDTFKEAFDFLNRVYNYITHDVNIRTIKISEVYNDVKPPIKVLRKLKLEKILKVL